MRPIIALAAVALLPAVALGGISTSVQVYQPPDVNDSTVADFNDGRYWTIDLRVNISSGDAWTSSSIAAEIATAASATLFQHANGGDLAPNSAFFPVFPALEYDTYIRGTTSVGSLIGPVVSDSKRFSGTVFGIPSPNGSGDFLIGRFTVRLSDAEVAAGVKLTAQPGGASFMQISGAHTTVQVSALTSYNFTVYVEQAGGGGGGGGGGPVQPPSSPCIGDLNNDGRRDADDVPIFLAAWRKTVSGDLNGDGKTDERDLAIFLANFGLPCEQIGSEE